MLNHYYKQGLPFSKERQAFIFNETCLFVNQGLGSAGEGLRFL